MPKASKKTPAKASKQPKVMAAKSRAVLPGSVGFSKKVFSILRQNRAVFLRLTVLVAVASLLLSGVTAYSYYAGLTQATDEVAGQLPTGGFRTGVETAALTVSVVSGAASSNLTEAQQIFIGILYLLTWLITVWLLRHLMSTKTVRLRDGLYNAAAPLVSTCLVVLAGVIQLLPFALIVALIASVGSTGALHGLFWGLIGLILIVVFASLSLYWLSSTVFAAVIVTLPGTYPWAALRSARQVINGYRRDVIVRLVWLGLIVLVAMFAIVTPVVLLDALTGYRLSLVVILVTQFASVMLSVYASAYVYLLYREVIDERS